MVKVKTDKRKRMIMLIAIIFPIVLIGYLIAIHILPVFIIYSDQNTVTHNGTVTSVYLESDYTGYKTRKRSMVYVVLDNGSTLHISNLTLRKNGIEYESLRNDILDKPVEIKASKADDSKIVSIECGENELLTFDDINRTSQSNRIGLSLVCLVIMAFIVITN